MTTTAVLIITKSRDFFAAAFSALNDTKGHFFDEMEIASEFEAAYTVGQPDIVYREAHQKAVKFLSRVKKTITLELHQYMDLFEACDCLTRRVSEPDASSFEVGMVIYDHASVATEDIEIDTIDNHLLTFYQRLDDAGISVYRTAFSSIVYVRELPGDMYYLPQHYRQFVKPERLGMLRTELLCQWMDFLEVNFLNRRVQPGMVDVRNMLANQLLPFFKRVSPEGWLLSYYTGSIVSNLIDFLARHAADYNGLLLRGPNEHALACGAMAAWQLYKKPFLLVVTSAMMDEFKGTLANLKEAAARGIIVVAENRSNQWYAFQGTITPTEDMREVLTARRIPYVYMDDVNQLEENLLSAFDKFHDGQGPVVLLVTQNVLEASNSHEHCIVDQFFAQLEMREQSSSCDDESDSAFEKALQLINSGPDKVVWQLGPVDDEEYALIHEIAEIAGIALVDSLVHPGSVPKYYRQTFNPFYLGTLAIYGYSAQVYNYFHTSDKLNPFDSQCLFLIKSRLSQLATPFSEAKLARRVQVVQLTHTPEHMSPFADTRLQMDCKVFLTRVRARLEVNPALRQRRLAVLASYYASPSDVIGKLPSSPMSPNYFFRELNHVLERLIGERGYDYTGVYDVGRCGISAVRNLARTRRGFSGWYGRALMGDALLSCLYLAHISPTNVLAFIGDGAKGIVPDILPAFIENLMLNRDGLHNKNISIFYFCNGSLSLINTYQERIILNRCSPQMRLVNLNNEDSEMTIDGYLISHKNISHFDAGAMEQALTAPGRLNLFSVQVSHNNEGDGISLAVANGWQRDPCYVQDAEKYAIETADSALETLETTEYSI